MPPKAKFTKEQIVDVAVQVTREKGIEAVTAREMGNALGVSTRPVFTWFPTIDALRAFAPSGNCSSLTGVSSWMLTVWVSSASPEPVMTQSVLRLVIDGSAANAAVHSSRQQRKHISRRFIRSPAFPDRSCVNTVP